MIGPGESNFMVHPSEAKWQIGKTLRDFNARKRQFFCFLFACFFSSRKFSNCFVLTNIELPFFARFSWETYFGILTIANHKKLCNFEAFFNKILEPNSIESLCMNSFWISQLFLVFHARAISGNLDQKFWHLIAVFHLQASLKSSIILPFSRTSFMNILPFISPRMIHMSTLPRFLQILLLC